MSELVIGQTDNNVPVQLGDLPVTIERCYEEPPRSLTRVTTPAIGHQPAVVSGVSMKSGRNVVEMSDAVDRVVERMRNSFLPPDIGLTRANDLPRQVNMRIVDFQFNVLQGILIVLAVAFLTMGWRPALIMAAALPLSLLGAIAVGRCSGIELAQFSIASLIISLGMVVDNAIVVSDNTVRLLQEGRPKT